MAIASDPPIVGTFRLWKCGQLNITPINMTQDKRRPSYISGDLSSTYSRCPPEGTWKYNHKPCYPCIPKHPETLNGSRCNSSSTEPGVLVAITGYGPIPP
ncbi:hypothetical protein AVEN_159352-1 [Araneus ventricosus]|uniref:Uncharacterized protein n=1 Tax=Araneus ventricosus TaxID=182803 RepID=A0A4Y2A185_ARAVE|nr:hypothetical protein AVEN_159352-1 [Araneus ventricosus]